MIIGIFVLGLFSLRKKIEDAVVRAEMLAPTALELEEAKRNRQEAIIRDYNLWDDTAKSNEILSKLADSAKVVDALKDLTYKVMCNADLLWNLFVVCGRLTIFSRTQHLPSLQGHNYRRMFNSAFAKICFFHMFDIPKHEQNYI